MKYILKLVIICSLLFSCGNNQNENLGSANLESDEINSFVSLKGLSKQRASEGSVNNGRTTDQGLSKKLIKNGYVAFETYDLAKTKETINDNVKTYKGYISSDNEHKSDDRISSTINVRIPSESFDVFLSEISKGIERFDNKNINIRDVTEQFLDIESRLKNKKKLENKYLEILQKAKTVREILDVERELGKLRQDIESTEGRLKYLSNQVSFSTLNITFYKLEANQTSFGRKIKEGFKNGFNNLKSFFIGVINIWPFIIIGFMVFYLFRKWRRKRKNK
ncbi:uncharacterized protein DUF4349 [Lutibacter sp. Hel_I_33_5]|uniref:DUF4349 domain-containing protein n=1 Tax=Lutibacter sp. Hel_I_33_5 TaxID=1566289 RepID=UPI00119DD5DB|nr:DUF4349 domain-containing protein [Lutibacter sp. Hel_I_33_5]TVZ55258.1 uncharacterized protein DUF4349 [Lutibacter sp. Hel_I_33_5]